MGVEEFSSPELARIDYIGCDYDDARRGAKEIILEYCERDQIDDLIAGLYGPERELTDKIRDEINCLLQALHMLRYEVMAWAARTSGLIRCSICNKLIEERFSCDAEPVNKRRCCRDCDNDVVIPARLKEAREEKQRNA
jgi:hypothetical protein